MTEEEWVPTQEFICRGERTPKGVAIKFDKVYGEVVRCKDCKHHEDEQAGMVYCQHVIGGWVDEDWFCADGERKES